ncbi:MAG: trigger factor family protein [Collinsella sp.]
MNITSDVKDAKLTATVTIPAADVDAAIKKAYKQAAKQYRFPGFRARQGSASPSSTPLSVPTAVLAQATNELILGSNEGNVLNELDIVPVKEGDYQEIDLCCRRHRLHLHRRVHPAPIR